MDLPFHLKALPPEALDVLRFFGTLDHPVSHADEIMEGVDLSERLFGKVIRRLVTKGYVQMDGDQAYRLTDDGQSAVEELTEYDANAPAQPTNTSRRVIQQVKRRLVMVVPRTLAAGQPATIQIGFRNPASGELLSDPADLVMRVSLLNGEPTRPQEAALHLGNRSEHREFTVTPGQFECLRIRAHVFQLGPNPDDINIAGGMYVDVDVQSSVDPAANSLVAYGADIVLTQIVE
jgi:predicted transcriptional regulator